MLKRIIATMLVFVTVIGLLPVLPVSMEAEAATTYNANIVAQYAKDTAGSSYAKNYCLAFVHGMFDDCYGFSSSACCAYKYGSSYIDSTSKSNIPIGADVFFGGSDVVCSCGNKAGHVGIYVGDGYVVHAWGGKIVKSTMSYIINCGYPYRGWGWHGNKSFTTETPDAATPIISGHNSPSSIVAGNSFTIYGVVYCNSNITSLTAGVYTSSSGGTMVTGKTVSPKSKTYSISKVDPYVLFDELDAGTYYYRVTATSSAGTATLINKKFTVTDPAKPSISGYTYPTALDVGEAFTLKGTVSCGVNITSLTAGVYTASSGGTMKTGKTVSPGAKSYSISKIDPYVLFDDLSAGTYYYRITAKTSGGTYTLVNKKFTVGNLYTITYNANGGSGAPDSQTKVQGTTLTLSSTKPTKDGYIFVEWNTAKDGSGTSYSAGGKYTANAKATLYAQWKAASYYLDLNANVDGTVYSSFSNYGTADVYVDDVRVGNDVSDIYKLLVNGSTYKITDIKAKLGYQYTGSATLTGTISGKNTGVYLTYKKANYYFDLNGKVNGTSQGNITNIGTADVYINGVKVANDVSDFYKSVPNGSTYKITDIKAKTGYTYAGAATITGTVNGKNTGVSLIYGKAATHYYLDLNAKINGTVYGSFSNYGTADVYVNGTKVANDVSDLYKYIANGSTYKITDIKGKNGYSYVGSATITGTINGKTTGVYLSFTNKSYYLDLNAKVNGTVYGNFSSIGTADVYVNGVKVADNVSDLYKLIPNGSTYKITDIKAKSGYTYTGPSTVTGTMNGKNTGVYLEFKG